MPETDDPFTPPDLTVLRPRPGAGRRQGAGPVITPGVPAPEPGPGLAGVRPARLSGSNPLVEAATPLLLLSGHLRSTLAGPDLESLRRQMLDEIRRFEEQARSSGVSNEVVLSARYALCAALDEAVLSTPWGAQSAWAQQTLLIDLHREAWGGEKFFQMLDRIAQDPARFIDLMELQYLCLAFGFAGKYHVLERGHTRLAEVQQELYRTIRAHRGAAPPALSLRWRGVEHPRHRLIRYVPWWVVGAGALALVTLVFAISYSRLASASAPVHQALANVGREAFTGPAPAPQPSAGPTLEELLAEEETRGRLQIEEEGGRTVITLSGGDLFPSGSATPNPAYDATLRQVTAALNRVPGRVQVVGHTDDQPLRSLRYANNDELSRERARQVLERLVTGADNPARFQSVGVGSSEPRFTPESLPENRARNRRVEIVHVRGS